MHPHPLLTIFTFWITLIVVAALSLMPTNYLPPTVLSIWDKAQHALGFAVLALLGHLAYPQRYTDIAMALLLYGGAIELVQAATGWRFGEWLDLLADAAGILVGSAFVFGVRKSSSR